MNILLVNPKNSVVSVPDQSGGKVRGLVYRFLLNKPAYFAVPLALPTLAALTPEEDQVRIVDEMVEPIDFDAGVDLVGIKGMTCKATRAYQIAQEFRKRGITTIFGGIHASMCPDEAAAFVDSVVVGEAEEVWPKVLADFKSGKLQRRYQVSSFPDVTKLPSPRYGVTAHKRYFSFAVQTTRGCPNACDFCTVSAINGRPLRRKSPQQVIQEIESVLKYTRTPFVLENQDRPGDRRRLEAAMILISDDNFAIDRRHALAMCDALYNFQLKKHIFINLCTNLNFRIGFDNELLQKMRDAGCFSLFIGFESLNEETFRVMKEKMNTPEQYAESIENIRKHGIEVYYSTILGGEYDTSRAADELVDFVEKNKIFYVWPNILTPHPGTPLRKRLEEEGRVIDTTPQAYDQQTVVFRPNLMSPEELANSYMRVCYKVFDHKSLLKRAEALLSYPAPFRLVGIWRVIALIWFFVAFVVLAMKRAISVRCFFELIRVAPRFLIKHGSLKALDYLVYCAEMDAFS
jgi:radical SAM superfamily enzyme YgiQ (UPF0313 family)